MKIRWNLSQLKLSTLKLSNLQLSDLKLSNLKLSNLKLSNLKLSNLKLSHLKPSDRRKLGVGSLIGSSLLSLAVLGLSEISLARDSTGDRSRTAVENSLFSQNSLAQNSLAQNSLAQNPLTQDSFSQNPLFQNHLSQSRLSNVYAVSPTIIAIEVAAPDVQLAEQRPYRARLGDIVVDHPRASQVKRFGQSIGVLAGAKRDTFYGFDQVQNTSFDEGAADLPNSYRITSQNDANYSSAISPSQVFRKTKPTAFANRGPKGYAWPAKHTLYLALPQPMEAEKSYQISFPGIDLPEAQLRYSPLHIRSEAVHVSQLGFRPDDPVKLGYLSTWMGNGGSLDYQNGLSFWLVAAQTDRPVYQGTANYVRGQSQAEDPKGIDYTRSEVHRLDFSDFKTPGRYRLCVQGVGCSFEFEIAQTAWEKAFETAIRGFYHQRSGIAIGKPFSDYTRPRAFHPADGVKVYQSGVSLLEVDMGLGSRDAFEALTATRTEEIVPNAWGGYFDAADWDRRIQHLEVPQALLELHNLFPQHFDAVTLNIPESNNALPDMLDEALWSLDFFRRLQTPAGGIRGGIESAEHPNMGETSWQESLTVMAYAPDVWSSYWYAGVAARAAYTLKDYDSKLAATYQDSALRAMAFAEKEYAQLPDASELPHQVNDRRNLAALELYRLTGNQQWHNLFLATTIFKEGPAAPSVYEKQEQRDAAFLYARLSSDPDSADFAVDAQVQSYARESFLRYADALVALSNSTSFGWSKEHPYAPVGWNNGLGAPKSTNLFQAHVLTGDAKYLRAGLNAAQFSAGANPDNLVFTTGLGERSPQNPMIADYRITRQAPPPGITLYGPADFTIYRDDWSFKLFADKAFPPAQDWPTVESYFDVYQHPIAAEFTVDYMVAAAYTWGYLAAR